MKTKPVKNRLLRALLALLLLSVIFFFLFFILQVVAYKFKIFSYLGMNLFLLSIFVSICMCIFGPIVVSIVVKDLYESKLISVLAAIAFIGHINVYNVIFPISLERSFSVRILVNLARAKNEQLTKSEIELLQPKDKIYALRYQEMSGSGLIKIQGESVMLTTSGKSIANLYVYLAEVIGYSGGFGCAAMETCE